MTAARALHDDALVIDGLVYHADGDVSDLVAGGINCLLYTSDAADDDYTV